MRPSDRDDAHRYDDLIDLPHPVSTTHPRMPRQDRAAQFSPFAALTGYGAAIDETARLTDERLELAEDGRSALDERLRLLQAHIGERPEIEATYFRPDARKPGGAYVTVRGAAQKLDAHRRILVLADGSRVPFEELYALEGELFSGLT